MFRVFGKIARRHPQLAYAGLGMSLQLECQYLQRTVTGFSSLMGPIEEALREKFFPALFGGEDINADFQQILGHSINHGSLVIPDPRLSEESAYNTSKADRGELVDSILGGSSVNYVVHRSCICKASLAVRRAKIHVKLGDLARRKELSGGQERNHLNRATRNGAWISTVPHCRNGMELSREEFQDNLRLIYGLMTQDIPATCDGCGNKFLIELALSYPKGFPCSCAARRRRKRVRHPSRLDHYP